MNFRGGPWDVSIRPLVDTTPIVDTFLNLMIFFFLTASFSEAETANRSRLDVNLPKDAVAGVAAKAGPAELAIEVDRDGRVAVDGAVATLREVEERLTKWKKTEGHGAVRIDADSQVSHGRVVEILGLAQKLRIERISIGVSERRE
ncbi:MAG: biopolymer transporter ExbD [Deltaproteobacteria bacterium]|nr:biopolymer transporter ExbD [Deltaproteobacteria bacterium]